MKDDHDYLLNDLLNMLQGYRVQYSADGLTRFTKPTTLRLWARSVAIGIAAYRACERKRRKK